MADLFIDSDGNLISDIDIKQALFNVGADQCDTLFIHSDIMFGSLIRGIKRIELLEAT